MRRRTRLLPVGLVLAQLADAAGNEIISRRFVEAHLDHLRVPQRLRPLLPIIKVLSSAGLVLGLRLPRLGAVTSACLVGYYTAAVGFHLRAGDYRVLAAPAGAFGGGAAATFVVVYRPAMARA